MSSNVIARVWMEMTEEMLTEDLVTVALVREKPSARMERLSTVTGCVLQRENGDGEIIQMHELLVGRAARGIVDGCREGIRGQQGRNIEADLVRFQAEGSAMGRGAVQGVVPDEGDAVRVGVRDCCAESAADQEGGPACLYVNRARPDPGRVREVEGHGGRLDVQDAAELDISRA